MTVRLYVGVYFPTWPFNGVILTDKVIFLAPCPELFRFSSALFLLQGDPAGTDMATLALQARIV